MTIKLKRAYDPPETGDGERYLVERLWPRGLSKEALGLTAWLKDLAPSTGLRKWYGHDVQRWPQFVTRYESELREPANAQLLGDIAAMARERTVTLVFAARDPEHSSARILKDMLEALAAEGR